MKLPPPAPASKHWDLDPATTFLNHGSFGACPRAVKQAQHDLRERLEAEPVRFMVEDYRGLLDQARAALASFLHADPADFAPISNATTAVATILHNMQGPTALQPGDEVLTNDHEYPACQNILRHTAAKFGAKVVTASIPFPCPSPQTVIDAVLAAVTSRTRLVLLSHVTSPSGLRFPVEEILPILHAQNIDTLIDGAHAPGMIPDLNLHRLNPTYYTANCHKWLCAPKGSAFLYVSKERRGRAPFRPLVLSNNAERPIPGRDQFLTEFDFLGTTDQTPFMCIPHSIRAMDDIAREFLPGASPSASCWPALIAHNHALALAGRDLLCNALNVEPPAPAGMLGSLATILLPQHPPELAARLRQRPTKYHDALQDTLIQRHHIQVPVWAIPGKPQRTLRISAQVYNSVEQYAYLANALVEELARERA